MLDEVREWNVERKWRKRPGILKQKYWHPGSGKIRIFLTNCSDFSTKPEKESLPASEQKYQKFKDCEKKYEASSLLSGECEATRMVSQNHQAVLTAHLRLKVTEGNPVRRVWQSSRKSDILQMQKQPAVFCQMSQRWEQGLIKQVVCRTVIGIQDYKNEDGRQRNLRIWKHQKEMLCLPFSLF